MKELSIFIDESGDFGPYSYHSPWYIVTMIFHDQDIDIQEPVLYLETQLNQLGYADHCVHTGPIIRNEEEYKDEDYIIRRKILNKMMIFLRQTGVKHKSFYIEKKHINDVIEATAKLSKQISMFLKDNMEFFNAYEVVKIYYDKGQIELNRMLAAIFNSFFSNVEFRRIKPKEYRLFQIADMVCTFKLVELKIENKLFKVSDEKFFGSVNDTKRNYIKIINRQEMK